MKFFSLHIAKAETLVDNTPPCHIPFTPEACWALLSSRLTQISPYSDLPIDIQLSYSSTYPLFFHSFFFSSLRDLLSVGRNIFAVSELAICDSAGWSDGGRETGQRQVKLTSVINNSLSAFYDPYKKDTKHFPQNLILSPSKQGCTDKSMFFFYFLLQINLFYKLLSEIYQCSQ